MAKCQIRGCENNTPPGKKLCNVHYSEIIGNGGKKSKPINGPKRNTKPGEFRKNGPGKKPPRKPRTPEKPRVPTFILRGHTLTINYSAKTKHVNIDRITRAVKYNELQRGVDGEYHKYIIEVKQGLNVVASILYDTKSSRDNDFIKLQNILASVY
jgi:hypothetical protein